MNRRDALKQLGAAGAVVAGASVVTSSPAFAYDLPSNVVAATLTLENGPGDLGDLRVSYAFAGSADCPMSANSTSATPSNQTVQLQRITGVGAVTFRLTSPGAGSDMVSDGDLSATNGIAQGRTIASTVRFDNAAPGVSIPFINTEEIIFIVRRTFTCTYSDGTTRSVDAETRYRALVVGGSWTLAFVSGP